MATLRVPEVVPSPTQDCEKLRDAVQGLGTDEEAIIWILGHRNASQRKKIRETYQQLYNESLIDRLNSELSGDFRILGASSRMTGNCCLNWDGPLSRGGCKEVIF